LAAFIGIAVSLAFCSIADGQEQSSFIAPSVLTFQEGQLVDQVLSTQGSATEELPARLPPLNHAAEAQDAYCPYPIKDYMGYPGKALSSATATIPQYLPEGLVPQITGPTSESHRAYAVGTPLQGTSWLAASHSAGFFVGGIGGAMLIDDRLEQSIGGTFGLRFGIDYDHRWGLEKRFCFAEMNVFDVSNHQRQIVNLEMGDLDLMFYPWGDTRWRPYISAGAGLSHFNYESDSGRRIDRLLIGLPFGIGVKYFWSEGVAVRAELVDNMMLGAHELSTMNNISLAAGVEFRYSGLFLRAHKG
jgi:opacity protein-like surface antigen